MKVAKRFLNTLITLKEEIDGRTKFFSNILFQNHFMTRGVILINKPNGFKTKINSNLQLIKTI